MTVAGFLVRKALTDIARTRMRAEYEKLRADDVNVVDLVRQYGPGVYEGVTELSTRLLADRPNLRTAQTLLSDAFDGDFDAQRLRLRYLQTRAERLVDDANAAQRHLEACEQAANEIEVRSDERIDELRASADEKAAALVNDAETQAEAAVESARRHLAETEQLAEAHVDDVRRRAHVVADRIVAQAEASRSATAAKALADLDAARIEARAISGRADAAVHRADEMARTLAGAAESADRTADQVVSGRRRQARAAGRQADDSTGELSRARRRRADNRLRHADLESMSRDELYRLAKEQQVPGRSTMSKSELAAALGR